jgi:hypothetical protein
MEKKNNSTPARPDGLEKTSPRDAVTLDHSCFANQIGTTITIPFENIDPVRLTLVEVSDLNQSGRQERFSVLFRGPLEFPLQQANYVVEHEEIGIFDLFIVPVARDEQGYSYEAVFNRLLSETS